MKYLTLILLSCLSLNGLAKTKTICGPTDDRVLSSDPKVARALESITSPAGCTVTMISNNCAISAGHCKNVLKIAEFNTPESKDGRIQHPEMIDIYEIEQASINYKNGGPGNDYAVFKLKKNSISGKSAGEVQGFYNVSFERPTLGSTLRITGYGVDKEPNTFAAQQTNTGELVSIGSLTDTQDDYDDDWNGKPYSTLSHTVDTTGGNSGSSILDNTTEEIVGIHTHGGCGVTYGSNSGTVISKHQVLMDHIKSCLASDK